MSMYISLPLIVRGALEYDRTSLIKLRGKKDFANVILLTTNAKNRAR